MYVRVQMQLLLDKLKMLRGAVQNYLERQQRKLRGQRQQEYMRVYRVRQNIDVAAARWADDAESQSQTILRDAQGNSMEKTSGMRETYKKIRDGPMRVGKENQCKQGTRQQRKELQEDHKMKVKGGKKPKKTYIFSKLIICQVVLLLFLTFCSIIFLHFALVMLQNICKGQRM